MPLPGLSQPFIAADVGGTHVRVGLVKAGPDAHAPLQVLAYSKFRCADYAGLDAILRDFLDGLPGAAQVRTAVIASAGYPLADGTVITANLPWRLAPAAIRDSLELPPAAFSYLNSHGSLDLEHMRFFEELMNRLDADEDREAVVHTARVVYRLYGEMFRSLPLAR